MLPDWLGPSCQHFFQMLDARRLPHAIMLLGDEGLGKRALARWLSGLVLCASPSSRGPCGQCRSCRLLAAGTHPDYSLNEPAAGKQQIGIDQIRTLIGGAGLTGSGQRVFVIAPAEALNIHSANALLKTLEEPTPGTLLILVARKRSAVPATIVSRCHLHVLPRPDHEQAAQWLSAELTVSRSESAAALVRADGRLDLARVMLQGADQLEQVGDELEAVARGAVDLSDLAARWADDLLDARLSIMAMLLRKSAWLAAGVTPRYATGAEPQRLTAGMDLATLTDCYRGVNRYRSRLQGSLRPELQVEALLLEWQRLRRETPAD